MTDSQDQETGTSNPVDKPQPRRRKKSNSNIRQEAQRISGLIGISDPQPYIVVHQQTTSSKSENFETIEQAKVKNSGEDNLSAPVVLPQDMAVRLVQSDLLDYLDDVRSDENIAYLIVGTSIGAEVAIIVNWATADKEAEITKMSIVLAVLFAIALLGSIFWVWRLSARVQKLKSKMFGQDATSEK